MKEDGSLKVLEAPGGYKYFISDKSSSKEGMCKKKIFQIILISLFAS